MKPRERGGKPQNNRTRVINKSRAEMSVSKKALERGRKGGRDGEREEGGKKQRKTAPLD